MVEKQKEKVLFSWSGGKDSAMALHELLRDERYQVVALLTSVAEEHRRISHHGVREELLVQQAQAVGLPLDILYLPSGSSAPCTNEQFEELMERTLLKYRDDDVLLVAHGDIFLEDLRAYRERNLAKIGMKGLFPLWRRDTAQLAQEFVRAGFKAYVSCTEGKLGESFVGRAIDESFLADLPEGIDSCWEYGEYHSFVYDGPIFRWPVDVSVGRTVLRDTRYYADLLAGQHPTVESEVQIPPVR